MREYVSRAGISHGETMMRAADTAGEPLSAVVLSGGAGLCAAQLSMLQALVQASTSIDLMPNRSEPTPILRSQFLSRYQGGEVDGI